MHLIPAMQQMHRIVNQKTALQKTAHLRTAHQKTVLQKIKQVTAQIANSY